MFTSIEFWLLWIIAFAGCNLLPSSAIRLRVAILALLGITGSVVLLKLPVWIIFLLIISVVWISSGIHLASKRRSLQPAVATLAVMLPVLLLWLAGKEAVAAELDGHLAGLKLLYFVGFSYFLVKAWTLTKDCMDGRIKKYNPLLGFAYFFHLPTYLSGPMHYYSEFESSLKTPYSLTFEEIIDFLFRLLFGMIKVMVLAPLLVPISLLSLQNVTDIAMNQLLIGSIGYSFVLYLDFSGYSDMAIASSRLLGIAVPENFRHPYMACNIREFWQRWHITFSRTLTAYIFVPLSRFLQKKLPQSPRVVMITGYLATFAFAGYWHGPTANFILWGLYHAVGLIAYDLYRNWSIKRYGLPSRRKKQPAVVAVGIKYFTIAVTFLFVSLGWIFFVLPLDKLF